MHEFFTILGHRQREKKKLKLIKSKYWLELTMRVRLSSPSPINITKPSYLEVAFKVKVLAH